LENAFVCLHTALLVEPETGGVNAIAWETDGRRRFVLTPKPTNMDGFKM
jgi:hypothetical protein